MAIWQKKLAKGISIVATAAAVAAIFWWRQSPEARATSMTPPSEGPLSGPVNAANDSSAPPQSKPKPITAPLTSIRQRLKSSIDWYAFAKEILPQAQAGDPEAQYVLFKTSRTCHFKRGAEYESESAARERSLAMGVSADDAVRGFRQCHGFSTSEAQSLGDPWEWLQKATDAGYAPAQAETVKQRLLQDELKAAVRAGGSPSDPVVSLPPIGGEANPRELLAVAAQSADPDVLSAIGNLQYMLNPTQPKDVTNITTAAWLYAGCQRDCSGFGPTTVINCGPNDVNCVGVPNWLLKLVNNNWAPVQEKVNQINAVLKAKQWDQLPGLIVAGG